MRMAKRWLARMVSAGIFLTLFFGIQRLVMPKYASDPPEGNFTAEYYDETTRHDVVLIGDCEVYENIDPIYLWKEYGITSYIRGNAQQLTWQSYYMLEDTLRYETPKVVIYNVQALMHDAPQKEEYNRMVLDGMRWSLSKWNALRVSLCRGENMLDYVFPIFRYHKRITELSSEDFTYFFDRKKVTHNGYYMRIDVLPASESDVADTSWLLIRNRKTHPEKMDGGTGARETDDGKENEETEEKETDEKDSDERGDLEDPWVRIEDAHEDEPELQGGIRNDAEEEKEKFGTLPMEYLDRLRLLCEEKGIRLLLMKAPSLAPQWYESYDRQVVEYAGKYRLPYINFYDRLDETGIDYETDTYDGGLHMNLSGADKLTKYLGRVLKDDYGMPDHRGDPEYVRVYAQKEKFYQDMIAGQQTELERYGEVRSYS